MKKFIFTLVLAIAPFVTFAQSTAFTKFEDVKGIESLTISKNMFDMVGAIKTSATNEKSKMTMDLIKSLDYLKVFSTSEKKYRKEIKMAVTDYLKSNHLEQLMSFNDEKSKVKIFVSTAGDASIVKEGLVFIEDADDKKVVLLSFTGNINLKDLEGIKGLKDFK